MLCGIIGRLAGGRLCFIVSAVMLSLWPPRSIPRRRHGATSPRTGNLPKCSCFLLKPVCSGSKEKSMAECKLDEYWIMYLNYGKMGKLRCIILLFGAAKVGRESIHLSLSPHSTFLFLYLDQCLI